MGLKVGISHDTGKTTKGTIIRMGRNDMKKITQLAKTVQKYFTSIIRLLPFIFYQKQNPEKSEIKIASTDLDGSDTIIVLKGMGNKFKLVKALAQPKNIIYITNLDKYSAFDKTYIGRCFIVSSRYNCEEFHPGICIKAGTNDWFLRDDQYLVLQTIKN